MEEKRKKEKTGKPEKTEEMDSIDKGATAYGESKLEWRLPEQMAELLLKNGRPFVPRAISHKEFLEVAKILKNSANSWKGEEGGIEGGIEEVIMDMETKDALDYVENIIKGKAE